MCLWKYISYNTLSKFRTKRFRAVHSDACRVVVRVANYYDFENWQDKFFYYIPSYDTYT